MLQYLIPALPVAAVAAITKFYLSGSDLTPYDTPNIPVTFNSKTPSAGAADVETFLEDNFIAPAQGDSSESQKLTEKRARFNDMGCSRSFDATFIPDTVRFGGVELSGEWTIVKDSDPNRRLLYLHGGAFTVGSPVSHRAIITNIARRTGCVVYAPDYRLMPENNRIDSFTDCGAAYLWMLENGPEGARVVKTVAIAGDSAGGNLCLALLNWIKDKGHRYPDAAIALSPSVDSTFSSPSLKRNFKTDTMLRPLAGPLLKTPRAILLWAGWKVNKLSPSSSIMSPIFADLSGLPPVLIQVSSAEMLYDDARRYTNKARSQGSNVELQSWAHMCHVWQIFDEMLPEAHHAFDEMAAFLERHGF